MTIGSTNHFHHWFWKMSFLPKNLGISNTISTLLARRKMKNKKMTFLPEAKRVKDDIRYFQVLDPKPPKHLQKVHFSKQRIECSRIKKFFFFRKGSDRIFTVILHLISFRNRKWSTLLNRIPETFMRTKTICYWWRQRIKATEHFSATYFIYELNRRTKHYHRPFIHPSVHPFEQWKEPLIKTKHEPFQCQSDTLFGLHIFDNVRTECASMNRN